MFSSERHEIRNMFFTAWKKYLDKLPLEPLEAQIVDVILLHPEYQPIFSHPDRYQDKDFAEANPFFHIGLHLSLREQINTNRPAGIKIIYETLCQRYGDRHEVEHKMMDCLASVLWEAQQSGVMPAEENYLSRLREV